MEISFENFLLAECIHGKMMWPGNDQVIGKCLPLYGEWSEGENIIMSEFITKGDTVIDIGANIGTTVLSLSKNVGKEGNVIAFEPQNIMSQCLQTNLTLNDITNVSVYTLGVSSKSGWANLNDSDFSEIGRYGEAGISEKGTRIKTIKLDEIEVNKCSLIKIDVEAHEWEVIQGGKNFLKNHKPVLYMEAKREVEGTKKYLKWLFENGWKCYWHYAFWYREDNFRNHKKPIHDPGTGDMNIVAVPKEKLQPNNLLKINKFDDQWDGEKYKSFYIKNNLTII